MVQNDPNRADIQILKVVIGHAFGAYFVWWSLEVRALMAAAHKR